MENSNVTTFKPKDKSDKKEILNSLSPREIVSELDRFVVGQKMQKEQWQSLLETDGEDRL